MGYRKVIGMLKTAADARDFAVQNPGWSAADKTHNAAMAAARAQGHVAQQLKDAPWYAFGIPNLIGHTMGAWNSMRRAINEWGTPINLQYARNPGLYEFLTGMEREKDKPLVDPRYPQAPTHAFGRRDATPAGRSIPAIDRGRPA